MSITGFYEAFLVFSEVVAILKFEGTPSAVFLDGLLSVDNKQPPSVRLKSVGKSR
jgi:hypothetical protein